MSAEALLIGALLVSPEEIRQATSLGLTGLDFADLELGAIFADLAAAVAAGTPSDPASVAMRLGGDSIIRVGQLMADAPVGQNLGYFAKEILDSRWVGQAQQRYHDLLKRAQGRQPFEPIEPLRAGMVEACSALATEVVGEYATPTAAAGASDFVDALEAQILRHLSGKPPGITTGFSRLDALTGGFYPGSYTILGARPSNGKSSLGVHFAVEAALAGAKTVYFTIEMRSAKIFNKALAKLTGVGLSKFSRGDLTDDEQSAIVRQTQLLSDSGFRVNDRMRGRFELFEAEIWRLADRGEVDVVFLDYIQQFHMDKRFSSRNDEVTLMSSRLQDLAKRFGIAVVAMAQLNRQAADKAEPPNKSQLRESGSLEQDADMILLIHRQDESDPQGPTSLILDKNREGQQGFLSVESDFATNRFHDRQGRR